MWSLANVNQSKGILKQFSWGESLPLNSFATFLTASFVKIVYSC